jgi:D-arginine dehydrogenase
MRHANSANDCDVIVIGAGIAGAGVAANLAARSRVILLERESQPGFHSTGRSAALFSEIYGNSHIRALSRASREFFLQPPAGFAQTDMLHDRGTLFLVTEPQEQQPLLDAMLREPDVARSTEILDVRDALAKCSILDGGKISGGLYEPDSKDIEVHELHHGFLRMLRSHGGKVCNSAGVDAIEFIAGRWNVLAGEQCFSAPVIVNAAGAWADPVAALAGLKAIGLSPKLRSAALVPVPADVNIAHFPLVIDFAEQFYFKPDAGQLLISPADETPSAPCDAQPDEMDIAIAIDRIEQVTTLNINRVSHRWAGLRTFAVDKSPVVGWDPRAAGFFWLAGQGGYGIQTAPALSQLAAALILNEAVPGRLIDHGVDAAALDPKRLL